MSQTATEVKRLYRFMAAKWAKKSIETRELRVGRLNELNDPFEFVPGIEGLRDDAPIDYIREQLWKIQSSLNSKMGLLSFSSTCREPTLWSHYAESHKGIALGFDITLNANLDEVKYPDPPKRPTIHPRNPNYDDWMKCVIGTLTTKALGWKAEAEYRTPQHFTWCRQSESGDYFVSINDNTRVLVEVILGCRCTVNKAEIEQVLKQSGFDQVRIICAKLSIDKFEVEC